MACLTNVTKKKDLVTVGYMYLRYILMPCRCHCCEENMVNSWILSTKIFFEIKDVLALHYNLLNF